MYSISRDVAQTAPVLFLALVVATPLGADTRSNGTWNIATTDKLVKAKRTDRLWSSVEVPKDIDQTQELDYGCFFVAARANSEREGVAKVRLAWETRILLLDHRSSTFETIDRITGTAKSSGEGTLSISIAISRATTAAIFADGFESGDLSARIVTTGQVTRGGKINHTELQCFLADSPTD